MQDLLVAFQQVLQPGVLLYLILALPRFSGRDSTWPYCYYGGSYSDSSTFGFLQQVVWEY